jgi:2-keto-4-pentenoate hydratase/2-oxohepta-3-ene-1,7-dioic acid hydratase in catechol pathway
MAADHTPLLEVADLGARLANLQTGRGPTLGVEVEGGVLDVSATAEQLGLAAPRDMDELLQRQAAGEVRAVLDGAASRPDAAVRVADDDLAFAPLVTRPEKIICIGFNYCKHAEETGTPIPKKPPLFSKFANALNRHGGVVRLPTRADDRFDFETELVVVFGRECRGATEANALDHVAGYATGNDLSARTLQMQTSQFLAGKTSDGFAPIGPWLVTRDRVPDPNHLKLKTWVNGEVRQDWSTDDMIFNVRQLIVFLSSIMTLKPGDILFTGTPQGVILGEKIPPEERRWLRPGDEVVSELEGLGQLRFTLA